MRNTHATGVGSGDATPDGTVCVARDQDDPRCIYIELDELVNAHVAEDCGGRRTKLARPNLAGYIPPALIPAGAAFGYDRSHPPKPGKREVRIKVLVREDMTSPAVLAELRERAARAKLRCGYRLPRSGPEPLDD